MSVKTFVFLLLAAVVLTLLAGFVMFLRSMFVATRGRKIAPYPEPRRALVVLDIQEGYTGTATRQPVTIPPATGMLATVNRLIDWAEASGAELAYVRQVFGNNLIVRLHGGRRQGRVIIDRRIRVVNGNDFEKNRTDTFSNRQFFMPGSFLYSLAPSLDTRKFRNGVYTVTVTVSDESGNSSNAWQRFTVTNVPGTSSGCPLPPPVDQRPSSSP